MMNKTRSLFELLKKREILDILIGDISFGELELKNKSGKNITISLPYLSGPSLCQISQKFGLGISYSWEGGSKSRWQYMQDLIGHCINNNNISNLLFFVFSKGQFSEKLSGLTEIEVEKTYKIITSSILEHINGELSFGGNELVCVQGKYLINKKGDSIIVNTPAIKVIDRHYIIDLSERAMNDITEGNFDSAITKSRTLLEEVFCFVIEKKGEKPSDSGDINKLYKQVKDLYNMHPKDDMDIRFKMLLSGLEKILTAIKEMRNKDSDAHGVGAKRIQIADYHARLFVNSSMTMSDFILSVSENALSKK
ncbi:MAG: abortive infection family protein [Oscillospiraceae bacterium]